MIMIKYTSTSPPPLIPSVTLHNFLLDCSYTSIPAPCEEGEMLSTHAFIIPESLLSTRIHHCSSTQIQNDLLQSMHHAR